MRSLTSALTLLTLIALVFAWTPQDYEIFKINDAVRADKTLSANVSFYEWLGIKQSASQKEIDKAYRKLAGTLHPDRLKATYVARYKKKYDGKAPSNKQVKAYNKEIEERSGRLAIVGEILRGDGRERYDYFLKNGFPKYKGTGYFYERYRPGTGTVLVGLFIVFGGVAHYGALFLTYKRHKEFVERYIKHARKMAWGDSSGIAGIPGSNGSANGATGFESATQPEDDGNAQAWNRKARRQQEKESKKAGKNPKAARAAREKGISTPVEAELTSGPVGAKKRVHAQNGKVLIVDSVGNVFVEEQTEEGDTIELLLDIGAIQPPSILDTAVFQLPLLAYRKSIGRLINPAQVKAEEFAEDDADTLEDAALNDATSINKNEESERRQPKVRRR